MAVEILKDFFQCRVLQAVPA